MIKGRSWEQIVAVLLGSIVFGSAIGNLFPWESGRIVGAIAFPLLYLFLLYRVRSI